MTTEVLEQSAEERLVRRRASAEEFWSLPESVLPTEYIGGEIIMAPSPNAPLFVVEILSPGSVAHDTLTKRALYEKNGVREYWIVDVEKRTIAQLVLRRKHHVLTELGESDIIRSSALAGFEMRVGGLLGD